MSYKAVNVLDLFPELNKELFQLLVGLTPEEWNKPTAVPGRTVKDLAAHLLDGTMRRLAAQRDGYEGEKADIHSYEDLVNHIQRLNKDWIIAARRLSPKILIQLLRIMENELYEFFASLAPNGKAMFSVAWAGETESDNWFDIAREYTEKWHHQMQIRDAVGRKCLTETRLFKPVLDTFMLGLPYAYRNIEALEGTALLVNIQGNAGGKWFLERTKTGWQLKDELAAPTSNEVIMDQDIAWKLFTNSIDKLKVKESLIIKGDKELGESILKLVAVMS